MNAAWYSTVQRLKKLFPCLKWASYIGHAWSDVHSGEIETDEIEGDACVQKYVIAHVAEVIAETLADDDQVDNLLDELAEYDEYYDDDETDDDNGGEENYVISAVRCLINAKAIRAEHFDVYLHLAQRMENTAFVAELMNYKQCFNTGMDATDIESCEDLTFVITGKLNIFGNRENLIEYVESQGGHVSGSVSKKTSYLVNNDTTSKSSKNVKAQELGIPIISEEEFVKRFGAPDM